MTVEFANMWIHKGGPQDVPPETAKGLVQHFETVYTYITIQQNVH